MSNRIAIFEDDPSLGSQLEQHLQRAGFDTVWYQEGRLLGPEELSGLALVVLDLMLPGRHGFDILKDLRESSDVPVLVLSARNETHDKIRGLKLGADDYMTKPFWPEEFVERVRARLRRPVMQRKAGLSFGPLQVDPEAREVRVNDEPIALTRVEFELLYALCQRPGSAVTRRALAERALDPDRESDDRVLDAHVSRLRKKLGPGIVDTVWGIGYRLAVQDSDG